MRTRKKSRPKRERKSSYLLEHDQQIWLESVYPFLENKDISKKLWEKFFIKMDEKSIKNMAYRNGWYKDKEYIKLMRKRGSDYTNNLRWGTEL